MSGACCAGCIMRGTTGEFAILPASNLLQMLKCKGSQVWDGRITTACAATQMRVQAEDMQDMLKHLMVSRQLSFKCCHTLRIVAVLPEKATFAPQRALLCQDPHQPAPPAAIASSIHHHHHHHNDRIQGPYGVWRTHQQERSCCCQPAKGQ